MTPRTLATAEISQPVDADRRVDEIRPLNPAD
jgi:hypothetical protein